MQYKLHIEYSDYFQRDQGKSQEAPTTASAGSHLKQRTRELKAYASYVRISLRPFIEKQPLSFPIAMFDTATMTIITNLIECVASRV